MIRVADVMTTKLYTLRDTDSLLDAKTLMAQKRIRHVPVVDGGGFFVGLLTQRDLLAAALSTFADVSSKERNELETSIPVREVMITDIIVGDSETSLREAAQYILDTKHGCLPIVTDGLLQGILTEADFVKLYLTLLDKP